MNACVHCGRRLLQNVSLCPFCRNDPRPPPEPETKSEASRRIYRWHITPREQQKSIDLETEHKDQAQVIQALTSGSPVARDGAVELILSKKINVTDDLIAALENHTQVGREHIAKTLGRLGARKAIPALHKVINSAERALRLASIWAIHRIGDSSIISLLIENFKDNDAYIRRYIVYVLGGMNAKGAIPHIKKALQDVDPGVRRQAILSLISLEGRMAADSIRKALRDNDHQVRQVAAEALAVIKGPRRFKNALIAACLFISFLVLAAGLLIYRRGRPAKGGSQFPYIISIPDQEKGGGKSVH